MGSQQTGPEAPRHPVRLVSRRTGLTAHVLRVWERRYGVVRPVRSPGGQRLYSDADIERLRLLHEATRAGRSIGQVAVLSNETLVRLLGEDRRAEPEPLRIEVLESSRAGSAEGAEDFRIAAEQAVPRLDGARLEAVLRRAVLGLGVPAALDHVVVPLLGSIGQSWARGEITPAHEHVASAVIRRVLDTILRDCTAGPRAPVFVVATPAGQVHELGALLAAASAAAEGWRVVYLGSDLPARDIARAAADARARAVGLSIVFRGAGGGPEEEVAQLAAALSPGCPILVGGAAAHSVVDGLDTSRVHLVSDLPTFRARLGALEQTTRSS